LKFWVLLEKATIYLQNQMLFVSLFLPTDICV